MESIFSKSQDHRYGEEMVGFAWAGANAWRGPKVRMSSHGINQSWGGSIAHGGYSS